MNTFISNHSDGIQSLLYLGLNLSSSDKLTYGSVDGFLSCAEMR